MKTKSHSLCHILSLVVALAFLNLGSSQGAKPQVLNFDQWWTYTACATPLDLHIEATLYVITSPDGKTRLMTISFRQTFTNPETGKSVVLESAGPETSTTTVNADGNFLVQVTSNELQRLVVPGTTVAINAGRSQYSYVIDSLTGEMIEFNSGPANGRQDNIDAAICALLAP